MTTATIVVQLAALFTAGVAAGVLLERWLSARVRRRRAAELSARWERLFAEAKGVLVQIPDASVSVAELDDAADEAIVVVESGRSAGRAIGGGRRG
ncbi:hypothetical protein ABZ863_01795 [Saccharomonospora sp. NPDC046836]|uniref:hypothetical protein n=1 Tax=Saccharomonospora sp. NPDC046836 TaxID=3156921 RepID=UPI0033C322E4